MSGEQALEQRRERVDPHLPAHPGRRRQPDHLPHHLETGDQGEHQRRALRRMRAIEQGRDRAESETLDCLAA